ERIAGLTLGRFALSKRLPVAAGLGGGSADAAAALRLLAQANGIALDDPRLMQAAQATGADVLVCLDPRPRLMRGVGDVLSAPLELPRLFAVLINPGVAVSTREVFAALNLPPAGLPARPHVGFGCDLLWAVRDQCRGQCRSANGAGRLPAMVGARDGARRRA